MKLKLRHLQTQMLLAAFERAGILFDVWEIADDSNPYGHAGEDLIVSRHGDRKGFIFQNEDGGRLLWTAPAENPAQKRRVIATHALKSEDDAYEIVRTYTIIFGDPLVARPAKNLMKNNLYRFVSGLGEDLVVHIETSDKTELARKINAEFLHCIDSIPLLNHQHRVVTPDGEEFRTLRLRRWLVQNA